MAHLVLTELRPTGLLFAGKEILRDNSIKEAPDILRWRHRRIAFDHIEELFTYIAEMQYGNAIFVRGLTDATDRKIYRRKKCKEKPENVFHDHAAALLPFDIDDVAIPAEEWMSNPRRAIDRYVVKKLGPPFSETSYVAQFTGKHGLIRDQGRWTGEIGGDRARVRILFVTMRGLLASEAESWLELLHDTMLPEIDPTVGRLIQINYIARPKWHGHPRGVDPLGDLKTCWLVKRKLDRLPVPDLTEATQRSRQRRTKQRTENEAHAAATVAEHSDALTAICSIGLPTGRNDGQGDIYAHLLAAGRHMLTSHPVGKADHEEHAGMLRDQIATLCQQHRKIIEANLQQHERGDDWALIEKYLERDIARWIVWCIEYGGRQRHKPMRAGDIEQQQEDGTGLNAARMYCDELSDHLADGADDYHEQCAAVLDERKRYHEAEKEAEVKATEEKQRKAAEQQKAWEEKDNKRRQREAEQHAELADWGIIELEEVWNVPWGAICSVCLRGDQIRLYDVPGCSPVYLHLRCVSKWWKKPQERWPTQIKIEHSEFGECCHHCGRDALSSLWHQGKLFGYSLPGQPKITLHKDCAARHFKNGKK